MPLSTLERQTHLSKMPPKPVTFTPEQIVQVENRAPYLTREQLADFFGIHVNTFDAVRERQPEVEVAYKRARAEIIGQVAESLIQDALDGDTTSRIFFLKTQGGWRETNIHDHKSSDGSMTPGLVHFVAPQIEKNDKGDD